MSNCLASGCIIRISVLKQGDQNNLLNAFDIILDLYTPDWGTMTTGSNYRVLQMQTAPTMIDSRPYPYTIVPGRGIVVQHDFYWHQGE